MLAKIAPTSRDFRTLCDYLVRGKDGNPSKDRVAWVLSRNLPSDDAELVAKFMDATARMSIRTTRPVYHVMIAWSPDEHPVAETMQEIAVQALEMTGLGEHQAFLMGHGDTSHPHLHMVINRIHPETGKAWRVAHDYRLFDRVMRQLAEAHGFAHVPAHAFNMEETASLQKLPPSLARRAGKRGAPTNRPQWSRKDARKIAKRASEDLDAASTTTDLTEKLKDMGLRIEEKGRGYVVGNDDGYVKASSLEISSGSRSLRLLHSGRSSLLMVDGVDILRALRDWSLADDDDVRNAVDEARQARVSRELAELDQL